METELLSDIDPVLERAFESFGVAAQGILESFPWKEITAPNGVKRTFVAAVYPEHLFWPVFWRPNKVAWQARGFSVSKPADDWLLTFRLVDPDRARAAIARSSAVVATSEIPAPEELAYFEYQKAGVEFLIRTMSALLADEAGTGKTIQVCGLLNVMPTLSRVLIVCPASVKYVWERELARWLVQSRSFSVAGRFLDASADIVIINYDLLRKYDAVLKSVTFDLVVLDESQMIKTASALRSKGAKALCAKAPRKILLTGTPIMNRPAELWQLLNVLDAKSWGPFFPFARRYCAAFHGQWGWDFSGASNLEELSNRLRSSGMFLRRTKHDVLPQLPKVIHQIVPLDVDMSPILEELTEEAAAHLGHDADNLPFEIDPTNIPFQLISAIRHETGLLKCEAAVRFLKESEVDSTKCIVFAHHAAVLARLAADLGVAVKVTGDASLKNRQRAIDDFQSDPAINYFVASTTAMGVGITLTAASRVVFVESDWTPAVLEQAEARAHRIGQASSVLVQYLVVHDSIDERIMNALVSKRRVIAAVVEGPLTLVRKGPAKRAGSLLGSV